MGFFISFLPPPPPPSLPPSRATTTKNTTLIKFDYFSRKNNKKELPQANHFVAIWLFEYTVIFHRLCYHSIAMLKRHHFIVIRCCGVVWCDIWTNVFYLSLSLSENMLCKMITNEKMRKFQCIFVSKLTFLLQ